MSIHCPYIHFEFALFFSIFPTHRHEHLKAIPHLIKSGRHYVRTEGFSTSGGNLSLCPRVLTPVGSVGPQPRFDSERPSGHDWAMQQDVLACLCAWEHCRTALGGDGFVIFAHLREPRALFSFSKNFLRPWGLTKVNRGRHLKKRVQFSGRGSGVSGYLGSEVSTRVIISHWMLLAKGLMLWQPHLKFETTTSFWTLS